MTNNNFLPLLLIFVPLIIVTIPTLFINMKNYGIKISFRPPPIVFSIVWTILLLLFGISWFLSLSSNYIIQLLFIILTLLLASWIIIYKFNKFGGLINIIISLFITSVGAK